MLFDLANLPYWIFLGIGILLFLLVIFSGGGDDDLEIDTDVDLDADVDVDADVGFIPLEFLGWLGIGKAPLILLLAINFSAWGVSGWMLNTFIAGVIGTIPVGFLGGIVLASSFFISLILGSILARPLGKIFAAFGEDASGDRLIGCVGTVTSKQLPYLIEGKMGQADVLDAYNNLVTITVSLPHWAKVIPHHGQSILIIEQNQHCYLAIAKDTSDEDHWVNGIANQDK
jgi:hypothetical protein